MTETWCNPSITDADLSIPGYQLETELRKDRTDTANGIGGGLLVYSRNGLKILPLDTLQAVDFHQCVAFKVLTTGEPVNIVLTYRPPNSNRENFNKLLDILSKLPRDTVLIGDINIPHVDWTSGRGDARGRELFNTVLEENLEQLVNFPTHNKGSTLDLVITNMADKIVSVHDDGKLGRSDHSIITVDVKVSKTIKKEKPRTPNWTKADVTGMRQYLADIDWDTLLDGASTEKAWDTLKEILSQATQKFVPFSTAKGEDTPKWLNREIVRLVRKKKRAWKVYKLYNTSESRDRYKELEREATKKIRNAKRNMEKKLANSKGGNNSRKFANYIKSKTKTRISVGPLKSKEGTLLTEESEIAGELNTFFASVFTTEDVETVPNKAMETETVLNSVQITEGKIREKIQNLKQNSAAGPDGIGPHVLKAAVNELSKPLAYIFRESLKSGQVPRDWKHARVTPIYKKGPKGDPGNYRPVSLTSVPCRMLESIIKDDLMSHLEKNKLLRPSQHGFLKGRSCTTNLVTFMDKLSSIVDGGGAADVFYLDFAKAFDKVPHQRLLQKMKSKGITGEVFNWISAWLADRTQTVKVGAAESTPSEVKSGVPQGSVLGPPLFDIFIDDLDECAILIELLIKFADDTKGMQEIGGPEDRDRLQQTLDKLVAWAREWGMQFNVPKCKIMHVGNKNPCYSYVMAGQQLAEVDEEKDIGVTVHRSLKPSKHCRKAAGIAGAVLRQLARNFHYRDKNIFKKLYVQYVRPHLEFASPAWSPWLKEDKDILEKVQRKAVGMISGLEGGSYEEKCKELGLDTLEARREQQDLLETFKFMKCREQQTEGNLLKRPQERQRPATRSAADPWTLEVPRARLDIRKYSYTVRAPEQWNRLPASVKSKTSIQSFKNAIKNL